jgi:hypothetical protein
LPENALAPQLCDDRGSGSGAIDAFLCNGRSKMKKLFTTKSVAIKPIATMALLALIGGPAAMAQTGGTAGLPTANPGRPPPPEAPIGHRQPRADQVPSEKNLSDPNNPVNKEDAALDRKIKSICRGC